MPIAIIPIYHEHVSKILKLHGSYIIQLSMLNLPLDWDDYRLCDVENEPIVKIFANFFVKQYRSFHYDECVRIMNAQFKKDQSERVVHFFHAKMKMSSLVNFHIFIKT